MLPIEQYAIIGDTQTVALVGINGSIDWLCLPRFDSGACFAALLGTPQNGRWLIAPASDVTAVHRRYRGDSLVLETTFTTPTGVVRVVDTMPPRGREPDLVRLVEGVEGTVEMRTELIVRFDYGSAIPWMRRHDGVLHAIAGPDALALWTPVLTHGLGFTTEGSFAIRAGEQVPFVLMWHPSHLEVPTPLDAVQAVSDSERWWNEWCDAFTWNGPWGPDVLRSAITLKALTYAPTGGILAAATTSLPEKIGGVRNWDYRFCWLRDATHTLRALLACGFVAEARAWRDWLLRAVAGDPAQLQIMYGPAGERRLTELELRWLKGYEGSRPVRIGNLASSQLQLDVYGEVMDVLDVAGEAGIPPDLDAWNLQRTMLNQLEQMWDVPDEGIWEVRGPRRQFTQSKVMAWVAFDRGIKMIERDGVDGPLERWTELRDTIHHEVCRFAYDGKRNCFTQYYGSRELDASVLMMALVGFLSPADPRIQGTIAAIERHLMYRGFVHRYTMSEDGRVDGLPPGEGVFLPCSFWLADNYILQRRYEEALDLFQRLCGIANDVGLFSEEYDPRTKRFLGNFPQAYTHVSFINTARRLIAAQHASTKA